MHVRLFTAAARDVLEAGLAKLRLLAFGLGDDERAAAQIFGVVKLFFGQVEGFSLSDAPRRAGSDARVTPHCSAGWCGICRAGGVTDVAFPIT